MNILKLMVLDGVIEDLLSQLLEDKTSRTI